LIAVKELIPIVMALMLWGQHWSGNVVLIQCDNKAVVDVLNSGFAKDGILMHLLRCVFFISAHFEITTKAAHIPGRKNIAADALSRNNLCLFRAHVPQADPVPSQIPVEVVDLLVHQQPDWISTAWSRLFRNCLHSTFNEKGIQYGYESFCTLFKLNPYPTSEKILSLFVGYLYMEGLAPGTIKSYLAAVRYDQVTRGFGNPNIGGMPQLEYVVRGL
jgi:hypothetical protein